MKLSVEIRNRSGLAPGFIVSHNNKKIVSLSGAHEEVKSMMTTEVIPF